MVAMAVVDVVVVVAVVAMVFVVVVVVSECFPRLWVQFPGKHFLRSPVPRDG